MVFEEPHAGVKGEVVDDLTGHELQIGIDSHHDVLNHSRGIGGSIHFEHSSECRVGIGAAAASELRVRAWYVDIEQYKFHPFVKHISHLV